MRNLKQLLLKTVDVSPEFFGGWRILFGAYLTYYTIALFPYVTSLYSTESSFQGVQQWNGFVPSVYTLSAEPAFVLLVQAFAVLFSVCILCGVFRRLAAGGLYYILLSQQYQLHFLEDPSTPYINILLVSLILIPLGERFALSRVASAQSWYMPTVVWYAVLVSIGVGYSVSGFDKLQAYGWYYGDAFSYMLQMPIVLDTWVTQLLLLQPDWLLRIETWGIAVSMLLALPLMLWPLTRPYIWLILTIQFVGTLFVFDLAQVSLAMLLTHLFVWQRSWVPRYSTATMQVYYDTNCNFCKRYITFLKQRAAPDAFSWHSIYDSDYAAAQQKQAGRLTTMVTKVSERAFEKSTAGLLPFAQLGGWWRVWATLALVIPRPIRDVVYDKIAQNRRYL